MTTIITAALHGQYATGKMLRRDMGDPTWVDYYVHKIGKLTSAELQRLKPPLILVGYSLGGSVIADLTHELDLVGAVLYESPLLNDTIPAGTFPVLWIQNDYRHKTRRKREMDSSLAGWKENHQVTQLTGSGRHIRGVIGWPMWGHAWDQTLNDKIAGWLWRIISGTKERAI